LSGLWEEIDMNLSAQLRDIHKSYGPREVLHGVSVDIYPGEVHALLGANGSGKSTLVKILTGNEPPNAGTIVVPTGGQRTLRSPSDARAHGIRVVHQDTPFIDVMSVAENIALKLGYQARGGTISWRAVNAFARECLASLNVDIDPSRMAATLTASERGLIAVAIALADDAEPESSGATGNVADAGHQHPKADAGGENTDKGSGDPASLVLILDEATASISADEAQPLLTRVKALADTGVGVLMVTHRVREVVTFADRVSVLHDGNLVYTGAERLTEDDLVRLIINRPDSEPRAVSARASHSSHAENPVLTVDGLSSGLLTDASFSVGKGEMLGVVGGPASGVERIATALAGLEPDAKGTVTMSGKSSAVPHSPHEAFGLGIALVPRDRLRQGAVGILSVYENAVLPSAGGWRFKTPARKKMVDDLIARLDVQPPDPNALVGGLSGGNQQKLIVGKWMARHPRVLILDDPTVGIDPGARAILFRAVRDACEQEDLAVLLLSSEPEQLSEHCDRVIAVHGGTVAETLVDEDLNEMRITRWATA
jgi:ribose transport system ATP-binding protein